MRLSRQFIRVVRGDPGLSSVRVDGVLMTKGSNGSVHPALGTQIRSSRVALGVKRLLDVTLGIAIGAVALPLMVTIAIAICLDSPGPALFRPKRVGRHGRHFPMYKFRTMVKDAHERLHEVQHLNIAEGMVKIPDDPRVTRVGKWLRKFSLDELPQIYNVITGHMSLVGPRPHDVHELPASELETDPRLSMRPGLTGLWQISARSDPSLASRIHLDTAYVTGWSLLLDAKILARAIPAVVVGKGGSVPKLPPQMVTGTAPLSGNGNGASHTNGHATGAVTAARTSLLLSANGNQAIDKGSPRSLSSIGIPRLTYWTYDVLHTVADPILAALALILLALPLALLALLVKLDSPGPILFRQQRVGKDGELFEILKLRTMHQTAPKYSLKVRRDDSRVTSTGRILRSTGLDEVPQLWNVFRGHMRLIGPRPEQPFIADRYGPQERARLDVHPGITGWWQVHNRNEVPMHLNVEFDLYHIQHRSLSLDLQILLLTVRVLVNGFRRSHSASVALGSDHSGLVESVSSD